MITIEAAISYDMNGDILHKGDTVLLSESAFEDLINDHDFSVLPSNKKIEVEVYDVLSENRVSVIRPKDKTVVVTEGDWVEKKQELIEPVVFFEGKSLATENENNAMGRAHLMAPYDRLLLDAANLLLKLLKTVRKTVMPTDLNVKQVTHSEVNENGKILEGLISIEARVSDLMQKRKMACLIEFPIRKGEIQTPFGFKSSAGKMYIFNDIGFKKAMNLPHIPYLSKRPSRCTMSFLPDH